MNDNSYEDTAVRDAIRAAAAHEPLGTPLSTPLTEWTDHHGDVWQEHLVDPTLVRIVRFANGKLAPEDFYRPLTEVEKSYGELTQTAGASITDEDVAAWQVDDEEGGTGEVDLANRDSEVRYITEMNRQRTSATASSKRESPEARKLDDAAAELENITVMMKQAVLDLRASRGGQIHASAALGNAYARVYYLRRELGRVVAALGVGVPRSVVLRGIEKTYRGLIED